MKYFASLKVLREKGRALILSKRNSYVYGNVVEYRCYMTRFLKNTFKG